MDRPQYRPLKPEDLGFFTAEYGQKKQDPNQFEDVLGYCRRLHIFIADDDSSPDVRKDNEKQVVHFFKHGSIFRGPARAWWNRLAPAERASIAARGFEGVVEALRIRFYHGTSMDSVKFRMAVTREASRATQARPVLCARRASRPFKVRKASALLAAYQRAEFEAGRAPAPDDHHVPGYQHLAARDDPPGTRPPVAEAAAAAVQDVRRAAEARALALTHLRRGIAALEGLDPVSRPPGA